MNFLKTRFWIETLDRAVKSFAQGVLLAFGASDSGPFNAWEFDWKLGLGCGLGMTVISLLMSLGSGQIGTPGTPTALTLPPTTNDVASPP